MTPSVSVSRNVEATTLPNGLRVISETMPHVRSVSVGIWIGSGSRRESNAENGISHFIEHMVFKGTRNRTAEDIARVVDSCGGHLDAYTAKELVSYNCKVMDEHLPLAFDVLADLVLNPLFHTEDIEKEKSVILEEMKMEVDNPEYLVHETFFSHYWRNHPLGRSIVGTKATVRAFTSDIIETYYRRVYVPGNIIITAAGNIAHQRMVDLVSAYFTALPRLEAPSEDPAPRSTPPLVLKSKRSLEQVHVCLGVPAYPLAHEKRYGAYLLSTILGGGMSSRLFQNIRERHGLAYSVFSELNMFRDTGCLAVYSGTSTHTAKRVVQMTLDEFRRLRDEPVSEDELRRSKDHLKGSLALSLESTGSRMSNLARQELFFGRFFTVDEMVEAIEGVTAAEVQAIAREFFGGHRVGLTVLGRLNGFSVMPKELEC
ncbi:MAG: insulinase family protein [Acidobacteria bacterium]|nr:insulinase family protein [Acidobacteriota bacterium]